MKNRSVISLFTLILVIFGLFTACSDASGSGSPDLKYTVVPGDTLYAKLQWLSDNAASNSGYILEVTDDETLGPQSLSYGKSNITIQLKGIESPRVITLKNGASLFKIENGVTLILKENLILSMSNIEVNFGGKLVMNQGAKIIDRTTTGVNVNGGTFTMSGGEISGNKANNGGGVYINSGGTFTMSGGEISGNTSGGGGGVYVASGTFVMSGGKISDNTATNNSGGGVYVMKYGTFTMNGGEISGNTANSNNGSIIYTYMGCGGGVYIDGGTFTMNGGEISGNTANNNNNNGSLYRGCGGGVYINSGGTFTMRGGEISGNTSSYIGGGVYVGGGIFTKSGGTITGYASDTMKGNVVKNSSGVVQNNNGHAAYDGSTGGGRRRETTAGPKVNMKSGLNGAAGGWEY